MKASAGCDVLAGLSFGRFVPDDFKQALKLDDAHLFKLTPVQAAASYARRLFVKSDDVL
jgi:hypothetical protein